MRGEKGSHHRLVFGEKFRPSYGFSVVGNRFQERDGCMNNRHVIYCIIFFVRCPFVRRV